ncbi:putative lipid scramblase CLPTM1 [Tubulanus polymorphus]|uniref:putative lipid scramblase CLPTM1 n=1 Tax=Tubulanus polymorphus TaxID=672921 RepID=UPI003DA38D4C
MADQSGASANSDNSVANSEAANEGNDQNGQVNQQQDQQQQQQGQGGWAMFKSFIVRMAVIYFISSLFRSKTPATTNDSSTAAAKTGAPSIQAKNIFDKHVGMDMYIYLSEDEIFSKFKDKDSLLWKKTGLVYGDWTDGPNKDGSFVKSLTIPTPEGLQNNGSIYLHVYFVKSGRSPDPEDKAKYRKKETVYKKKQVNRYKKRKFHTTVNLLTGTSDAHPDLIKNKNDSGVVEILNHWHPNMTINLLDDHTPWVKGHIPQPLDEFIDFDETQMNYYPILYFNDYWNMNSEYMPVNHTVKQLNMTLTYSPMSLFRWQMYAAQGMRSKWYSFLGEDFMPEESDEDQDSLKRTFLETNPYLLALTIIVSIVHSVFEFLAFKNDIQFWKNRKSLEGLSVRSVFFNVFQSLIVVLYVLDNETNTVVRISVFVGLIIELWKIKKVINIEVDRENKWFGVIPRIRFSDKSTYTESQTKKYDQLAFRYLSWLLFPLLVAYSVYSLFYQEHKSWYSWVLSLLYGFLLTFGFIMMTPQLFINYKMKSVAHLPWRMLTYKALNTFIDDIFAFVIKMPTLYRIGCLRDDVIFFIYVYQRYIYPIDPKRMNEFGTSAEMLDSNGQAPAEPIDNGENAESSQASVENKPDTEKKND